MILSDKNFGYFIYEHNQWAQCLGAAGPTLEHQYLSTFLMILPDHRLKLVRIDTNNLWAYSKTSIKPIPHLQNYATHSIVYHDNAYIFGVTDYLYDTNLLTESGTAGFVTSTELRRKNQLFDANQVYAGDSMLSWYSGETVS